MLAKLQLVLSAAFFSGFVIVVAHSGAVAAVPPEPSALSPQESQQFKDLIAPATWNQDALVAWLEKLRETQPDPGVIGEISLDLALLVKDDNPNRDVILAALQDMLATAAGGRRAFRRVVRFVSFLLKLSEIPCTSSASPICNN